MKLTKFLINKDNYNIYFEKGVFAPTATTTFLINAFLKNKKKIYNKNILDLGCGSGIISIVINKKFKKNKFFASDVSIKAFNCTNKNFKYHKVNGLVKIGSLFYPWKNLKFNYILNDVSGVSDIIAKKSKWFKKIPSNSGSDGTKLTLLIIKNSSKYLKSKGKLYLPIISLSNEKKIINYAKKYFKKIKLVSSNDWFLPVELEKYKKLLFNLRKKRNINFDYKFGKFVCYTKILELRNS